MPSPSPPPKPQRIASVDALRGFSIFWLLGGEGAAQALGEMTRNDGPVLRPIGEFIAIQFQHAEWEGFRFWDFVFPLLIFVTGISIVFSLSKIVARADRVEAYKRVFWRAALLFVLGILFYGGMSKLWPDIRLLGVLQRIALCYLFASLLFLNLQWRGLTVAAAFILIGYWALLTFVPVPGVGVASYAPDVNLANWIDQHFLPGRKFDGTTDPEGLLSTLPAVATCLLGVLAGVLLQNERIAALRKAYALMIAGAAMLAAGYLWGLQFPVIKAIWTSSYVLVAAGYSALLLGVLYLVMDIRGRQAWAIIFIWIGANALALYFFNGVAGFEPFAKRLAGGNVSQFFDQAIAPGTGRFVTHVLALAIATALAGYLYRRRIFIRV
jgi:predicted acyltransferase